MSDPVQNKAIVEALIFAADEPVSLEAIAQILEVEAAVAEVTVAAIRDDYAQEGRGLRLTNVAGGYRFSTRPDYHPWVRMLFRNQRTVRLSRPALQTLAIVAYRQPVTAPEVEEIRGVEASGLLKNLLDKRLVTILGRKDVVGRPILYGTTNDFLVQFGLKSLDDLPSLEEFEELLKADFGVESVEVTDTMDSVAGDAPVAGAQATASPGEEGAGGGTRADGAPKPEGD